MLGIFGKPAPGGGASRNSESDNILPHSFLLGRLFELCLQFGLNDSFIPSHDATVAAERSKILFSGNTVGNESPTM
jgi:hypothetical protein